MYDFWLESPERMRWVGKNGKPKGCVFCRICRERPSPKNLILQKSENFAVVLNKFPYNSGHLMIIPVRHEEKLDEMSDAEISEMMVLTRKCMKLLRKVFSPLGFNVGFNQGGDEAGASIAHLHMHVVPRYKRDFSFIEIIGATKILPLTLEETYKRLRKHVKILE